MLGSSPTAPCAHSLSILLFHGTTEKGPNSKTEKGPNSKTEKSPNSKTEKGTEACGHLCDDRYCCNRAGSTQWRKEGNAIAQHEKSKSRHPRCTIACPKYDELSKPPRAPRKRSRLTTAQTEEDVDMESDVEEEDVDMEQGDDDDVEVGQGEFDISTSSYIHFSYVHHQLPQKFMISWWS
jgi:hypothetical protein